MIRKIIINHQGRAVFRAPWTAAMPEVDYREFDKGIVNQLRTQSDRQVHGQKEYMVTQKSAIQDWVRPDGREES